MSKPLIIAEKPAAARAIAEALGGFSSHGGYLESSTYRLTWAIGHLVEQMAPEDYEGRWKRWSMETLPILPTTFGVKVVPKTRDQFEVISRLARQAPELINACDAGREGELIFRYICQAAGIARPTRRLWISSLTKEAIRKGFTALRPAFEYDRLYHSALCRAQGDWLIGMNGSRAFTLKWGELLSIGRVQTPTLALMVRREQEIESFVPQEYWEVEATFEAGRQTYTGKWFGPDGDRIGREEEAGAIKARVEGQCGIVESSEEKPVSERPPQLFDLTTLQREANRRFGLTAAATLKAAQALYEAKLITYPRTDSRYLSHDLLQELPAALRAVAKAPGLSHLVSAADLTLVHPGNRRVVDDSKVTDHHAIIPTAEPPEGLSGVGAKIYDLIARRFLAQFYPALQAVQSEIITRVDIDRFRSRGRRVTEPGWRLVEPPAAKGKKGEQTGEEEENLTPLPKLKAQTEVLTRAIEVSKKSTEPPHRYSEARLLSAMETAGKEMSDESLREAMKGRGLGTPATRASIIERLKDVGYITLEKKSLVPTEKGRQLVTRAESVGAEVLLQAELTGDWEKRIADIQAGTFAPDKFILQIRDLTAQVVERVRRASDGAMPPKAARGARKGAEKVTEGPAIKCPRCGSSIQKGSKGWTCSGSECPLRVPSYLCGKVIEATTVRALLKKGKSSLISGFVSPRTGKVFSAFLVLKEGEVGFEFPEKKSKKPSGYRRQGKAK